jgi:signal transduction histidine kinase
MPSHSKNLQQATPPLHEHSEDRDESPGEHVSGASRRLRALAALSGSLTDALSPEDAATLVEQKALSALGATSAVVVTLGPFPPIAPGSSSATPGARQLNVLHAIGLSPKVLATLSQLPLEAPVPLAEVARSGQPMFLHSEHELRQYRGWGPQMIQAGARAAAVVPVWANGELRGVLGLTWPMPHLFDEDERAFVLTLGVMCAQSILRAHLRAAEQKAREDAERANRSKANFLATISHELRTPMNAVMGYTELLADEIVGPVSALQKDHLRRVRQSGKHLLGLIEDLLGYARIEAGEEVVRPEKVLLADIIDRSLGLVRPIAEQKGLGIRVGGSSTVLELHTDSRKLCQVIVNVLANAVKFTDSGEVELVIRSEVRESGVHVCFEVSDTGRGIAIQDQEHIFHAFWQQHPESTNTSGSTGLGLSVSRQLARLLGGDVTVARSSPNEGSTFVIAVPAHFEHVSDTVRVPFDDAPLIA